MTDVSNLTSRLGKRGRTLAPVVAAAVVSFALAAVGTAADGWPLPRAFDEFSYVLAGETFASGRLANPAYPLPAAVETIHVLQQPTHASKYLPGHGLFLALGTALGGGPRLGQWLAFALMGASVCWMLTGWLSRRAALITTGLFVLILADTEWASGYWGSSLAVAGSALVFGVIRRLNRRPSVGHGLLAGLGAVLLALTRPLEGLAVCVFPACYIVWWLFRSAPWRQRVLRIALPSGAVLALGAMLLIAHNRAVTGDALRLPYAHYERSAPGAPPFIWQPVNAPSGELRANEQARLRIDLGSYWGIRQHWLSAMWSRVRDLSLGYYFPHAAFATVFLLVPIALRRRRRLWLIAASAAAVGAAVGTSSFYLPHYLGPALPPLLILYAMGCGVVARLRWSEHRVGRSAIAGLSIMLGSLGIWQVFAHTPLERAMTLPTYWTRQREAIVQKVDAIPGKHVIFVQYAPSYTSQNEWVQNGADLTSSSLLWVHDLGDAANAALRQLEVDRMTWLVTVHGGTQPAELRRYDPPQYALSSEGECALGTPGKLVVAALTRSCPARR